MRGEGGTYVSMHVHAYVRALGETLWRSPLYTVKLADANAASRVSRRAIHRRKSSSIDPKIMRRGPKAGMTEKMTRIMAEDHIRRRAKPRIALRVKGES